VSSQTWELVESALTKIRFMRDLVKKLLQHLSQQQNQSQSQNKLDQQKNQSLAMIQAVRADQEAIRSVIAEKTTESTPSSVADKKLSSIRTEKATNTSIHKSMELPALAGMRHSLLTAVMKTRDHSMMHQDGAHSHGAMLIQTAKELTSSTLVSSATITNCGTVMVTAMETIT